MLEKEELGGDSIGHGNAAQETSNPTRTHEQLKEDVRRARAQQRGTAQRAFDLCEYLRFIQMRTQNDSHVYARKYCTRAEHEDSQLPGIAETSAVDTPELPRCEKSEGTRNLHASVK